MPGRRTPCEHCGHMPLTEREKHLLRCLGDGLTNAEIAHIWHRTEKAVKNANTRLFQTINVNSRTQAVLWGIAHGYIKVPKPKTVEGYLPLKKRL